MNFFLFNLTCDINVSENNSIIQNLHLKNNNMKQIMDVHAHAVNIIICQGTNVLYS